MKNQEGLGLTSQIAKLTEYLGQPVLDNNVPRTVSSLLLNIEGKVEEKDAFTCGYDFKCVLLIEGEDSAGESQTVREALLFSLNYESARTIDSCSVERASDCPKSPSYREQSGDWFDILELDSHFPEDMTKEFIKEAKEYKKKREEELEPLLKHWQYSRLSLTGASLSYSMRKHPKPTNNSGVGVSKLISGSCQLKGEPQKETMEFEA